jgi:hypothetical protein
VDSIQRRRQEGERLGDAGWFGFAFNLHDVGHAERSFDLVERRESCASHATGEQ